MRNLTKILIVLGVLFAVESSVTAAPKAPQGSEQGNIVIVFKDGHRQSFSLAEIARIEFNQPAGSVTKAGMAKFLGRWRVGLGDGSSDTFDIILKPNGSAEKTNTGGKGTWTVVNGEARVEWEDGWHDVIRKVGGRFQKAAYSPGTSYDEKPTDVSGAEYTEPN